jgi:hypothetical protein
MNQFCSSVANKKVKMLRRASEYSNTCVTGWLLGVTGWLLVKMWCFVVCNFQRSGEIVSLLKHYVSNG